MLKLEQLIVHGLEPVSLEIDAGECLAIQGDSGTGKTVLLRAIADLDLSQGHVMLDDAERASMSGPQWRSRVRYAAAEPGWWGEMPDEHFQDPKRAADSARTLGLDAAVMERPISQLSTGERQRLALVRALEGAPDVLLFDEPTGALDEKATAKVEKLLKGQLKEGRIILLVSHDPKQIKRLAHRKLTIRDGKVRVRRV